MVLPWPNGRVNSPTIRRSSATACSAACRPWPSRWCGCGGRRHATDVRATVALLVIGCWLGFAFAAQERVVRPLQTMSNLLLALREGDFSFRARGAKRRDPLGDVLAEINGLGENLQTQRRGAIEATALLSAAIKEIDVAIFAFDAEHVLRLVNPAGQSLLGQPAERLLGREPKAIGLGECREGESNRILGPVGASPRIRAVEHEKDHVPRGGPAPSPYRLRRPEPAPARGAAEGLAAAGARPGARAQQFACADQVDRRHAGLVDRAPAAAAGLGAGHAVWPGCHLREGREP